MGEHLARSGGIGVAALFDEPPVPRVHEHVASIPSWQASASAPSFGRSDGTSATIPGDTLRPLGQDLPPQEDPWLDDADASSRLRALLGADD